MNCSWRIAWPAVVLTVALYAITMGGTYVYDDRMAILDDPRVHEPARFGELWTRDYYNGRTVQVMYRPVTSSTYALQWWTHGDRAWAYHLLNVLLAAGASGLVALLAGRLFDARTGLTAGLLFAAHPAHVEAVANIVGRAELLCGVFALAALILVVRPGMSRLRAGAIVMLFLLALLSKEQGMVLPILILLAATFGRRERPPTDETPATAKQRDEAWQLLTLGLCLGLAGLIVLREEVLRLRFWWDRSGMDWTINPMVALDLGERWLMAITLAGHYLRLLVMPVHLSPDYSGSAIGLRFSAADPHFWLGLIAITTWSGIGAWALLKRKRAVLFCLLAFATLYGVISNSVELIGTIFGERLIYLPSAFFLILVAALLARLPGRAGVALVAALLIAGSVRTFTYAKRWNDPVALFASAVQTHPESARNYLTLAEELMRRHRYAEAEPVLRDAIERLPGYFEYWRSLAVVLIELGRYDEAEAAIAKVRELAPGFDIYPQTLLDERRATDR